MRRISALLLFLGLTTTVALSQQLPPPPPPPPSAAVMQQPAVQPDTSQQQSATPQSAAPQQAPAQQAPAQQAAPVQQSPSQDQAAPVQQPAPVQQTAPTQQAAPVQQAPAQPVAQQNPSTTQPNVPPPDQSSQQVTKTTTTTTKTTTEVTRGAAGSGEAKNLPQSDRVSQEDEMNAIREKADDRLQQSRDVLKELLSGKVRIANGLLKKAKCVVVIPSVKKVAFSLGVKYGRGVMSCRLGEDFNGLWSAPSMYSLEGGNFGFQVGLQGTDLVLLVMNSGGANSLLGSKVKLGGDMSIAAGPMGRAAQASTDLAMRAKILSYSRAHGIFIGVSLEGSTVRPDNRANEALYGREITAKDIVRSGEVGVPASATPLIQLLEQNTRAASESTPNEGHK